MKGESLSAWKRSKITGGGKNRRGGHKNGKPSSRRKGLFSPEAMAALKGQKAEEYVRKKPGSQNKKSPDAKKILRTGGGGDT